MISGIPTAFASQATRKTEKTSSGHEIQGTENIHEMFPWLGQIQGGPRITTCVHLVPVDIDKWYTQLKCAAKKSCNFYERESTLESALEIVSAEWHPQLRNFNLVYK